MTEYVYKLKNGKLVSAYADEKGNISISKEALEIMVNSWNEGYQKGQQYLLKDVLKKLKRSDLETFNQAIDYLQERLNELEEITDEKG